MRLLKNIQEKFDEKGVALPLVALMLTILLGMTALAVDLGWLYLNGSRVQRGADAAALAAVVHLPHNNAGVNSNTIDGANANGWDVGQLNGSPVAGGGTEIASWQPLSENRLEVTLTADVPTFFMRVFGMEEVTITRRATAEYIKPVPMGSPSSCFGITNYISNTSLTNQGLGNCIGWTMNFWAAINGPYTPKEQGDPFSTRCHEVNGSANACSPASNTNSQYRASGYYYGIEVPSGKSSFSVKAFDAGFYQRNVSNPCQYQTGDCIADGAEVTTHYTLYRPDDTSLDPTDNSSQVCSTDSFGPGNGSSINNWTTLCSLNNPPAGIYVLNVRTTGGGGNNAYSIGVSTTGGVATQHARVYAINDMSIFTNSGGSSVATVYLAEVAQSHAGKTLLLDFFDPGENPSGNAWVEVRNPHNGSAACSWTATNGQGSGGGTVNPCRIQSTSAGTAQFNGHWLNSRINIPTGYTCATSPMNPNCYWTMRLELGTTSQDRTTWAARVIGNPVRLVPNDPPATP